MSRVAQAAAGAKTTKVTQRAVPAAVLLSAAVLVTALSPSPAGAVTLPAVPAAVTMASATTSALTVSAPRAASATGYRLYASTKASDLSLANIKRARSSAESSSPRVTITGLPYSTVTWYYRLAAVNVSGQRYSAVAAANLRPATPTSPKIRSSPTGTSFTWVSGKTLDYRIAQATNSSMTKGRVNYKISGRARQFTPYGLSRGKRYYFRVSAINGSTSSPYSSLVSAVAKPTEEKLRVMTYNILASSTVGQIEGGRPLASWDKRRAGVIKLIRVGAPDVVAIQEGNGWVGKPEGYGGQRQVDDLAPLLGNAATGPAYALASTEVPPSQHGYLRTGRYIFYKKSAYVVSGIGGHWEIGAVKGQRWAAYQVLESRATGARFLFVSVHLSYVAGPDGDTQRRAETRRLIKQATAYAAEQGVPVVYAGDFNSHEGSNHKIDGPGLEFRAIHATDAFEVAQTRINARYNSANQNLRTPPANGRSIDHVYAPAGVALRSWASRTQPDQRQVRRHHPVGSQPPHGGRDASGGQADPELTQEHHLVGVADRRRS